VADTMDPRRLLVAIANLDHKAAVDLLNATPSLATARLARRDEFFLAERLAQVYEGDTALHAAGFAVHVAAGEFGVGVPNLLERVDRGDRHRQPTHATCSAIAARTPGVLA
jgi:hypothetical protein